jgi:poly(hydroxyalkanoate) granule-associated protein
MVRKIVNRQALRKNTRSKNVAASAQRVLLAGLGVLSKAQSESGKIAELLGDQTQALIAEGRKIEARMKAGAARKVMEMQAVTKSKTNQALNSVSRLEGIVEARVSRTLSTLGIPTGKQVRELTLRLEELQTSLSQLKPARA